MTLFQLLRIIDNSCPVKILDINNNVLESAYSKDALSIKLMDYDVFKINVNTIKHFVNEPECINITILK